MAEIISFDNRRQDLLDQEKARGRQKKIEAVRRAFNCSHCGAKCLKCGVYIDAENHPGRLTVQLRIPYRFCDACAEEYVDYIERLQGRGNPDAYWHNRQWLEAWGKWIDYQSSMDRYARSKEFLQLIHEIKPTTPEG